MVSSDFFNLSEVSFVFPEGNGEEREEDKKEGEEEGSEVPKGVGLIGFETLVTCGVLINRF